MEATHSEYNYLDSVSRIDELLHGSDYLYEDKDSIPARSTLTFENGFYVNATAIFVDIRGSKSLAEKHKKPVIAKVYRTYISEMVAVMKGHTKVNEIYIEGDSVWGVFDTPYKDDIDETFSLAARASSLIDILNYKFSKVGIAPLTIGVGVAYNSSLYIKAGYKSSGINEVVWVGELVGEAAQLCSYANRTYNDRETMVSRTVYNNLNDHNRGLLEYNSSRNCYHGYIIETAMNDWLKTQT